MWPFNHFRHRKSVRKLLEEVLANQAALSIQMRNMENHMTQQEDDLAAAVAQLGTDLGTIGTGVITLQGGLAQVLKDLQAAQQQNPSPVLAKAITDLQNAHAQASNIGQSVKGMQDSLPADAQPQPEPQPEPQPAPSDGQ